MDLIRLPFMSGTIRYRITNYHFAWTIEGGGGGQKKAVFVVDTQTWKLNQSVYTLS